MARGMLVKAGLRTLAGVAALAAGGVLVMVGLQSNWPGYRAEPQSVEVRPEPSGQVRVCPGPLLELADDAAAATTASSFDSPDLVTQVQPASATVQEIDLTAPDNPEADSDGTPTALVAEPTEVDAGLLAGVQSQEASTETMAGLAVAACRDALAESWLVGGSTALGRVTLVLLANPTDVAASVDLRIFGTDGPVDAPTARGIQVPPQEQRVISLAGLAPNLDSPVVQVTATGGRIAATLQQASIDGLVPAGADLVGATAAASSEQVIPGVVVAEAGGIAVDEDHLTGDGFPVVRLFAPGAEEADVELELVPAGGDEGELIEVELLPGQVTDVPLGDVPAGTYTVRIASDQPLVAAARSNIAPIPATGDTQSVGEPGDVAWFAAASPLVGDAAVAIADAPAPRLHLVNPTDETLSVVVAESSGEREVEIPSRAAVGVDVDPGSGFTLRDADGLYASVSYEDDRLIAATVVEPAAPADAPIRVYPH
ncbi:DUF5719 family protein [Agromyces sp. LHK192]|uniref:DUF5719 family protein n=1 Tax=Agromyces sp. LHK192 TaxID=2498704 RepID=UPI000FD86FEF|nr:DUF5719 family protein [Agromyces sp. LHK192]